MDDYMNLREAQEYLGISKVKMLQLVKEESIKTYESHLDKRVKLVKEADIKKLKTPR